MDRLVQHARAELELMGVEPGTAATLVATVATFVSCQPSPAQFGPMRAMLDALLAGRPLSPLSANPAEWEKQPGGSTGREVWVNRRDPRAVSQDGGRTYRLTDDEKKHIRRAAAPRGWVLALRERDGMPEDAAVDAVFAYLDAGPMTDTDWSMVDALPPGSVRRDFLESRWGRQGAVVASLLFDKSGGQDSDDCGRGSWPLPQAA